jgi:hypothetical protein
MTEANNQITDLIDNIVDGQHSSAKENFEDLMAHKISSILDNKKEQLSQDFLNKEDESDV